MMQYKTVLDRGLKIIVENTLPAYDFFTVKDWNTLSCHVNYLSTGSRSAISISINLDDKITEQMYGKEPPENE
jgi:hypothetical protein